MISTRFIKVIIGIFLCALPLNKIQAIEQNKTSLIKVVKDLHVASLDVPSEIAQPTIISEKDKKNLTLQINLLSPEQVIPMAYDLCMEHVQLGNYPHTETDPTFLTKMELFKGGEHKTDSLLNKIDHTKTSFGKVLLALQLAQPTHDVNVLTLRQELAQSLIENPELTQQIEEQLTIMAAAEPYLFSYFEKENSVNEELFKKVYFGAWLNALNTNATALEVITRLGNFGNLFAATFVPTLAFSGAVGVNYGIETYNYEMAPDINPQPSRLRAFSTTVKNIPNYLKTLDPRPKAFKETSFADLKEQLIASHYNPQIQQKLTPKTLGDVLQIADYEASKSPENAQAIRGVKIFYGGLFGCIALYQAYLTYTAIKDANLKKDISNFLQNKLIAVSSYIHAAKTLYEIAQTHPLLATLPGLHHIEHLFNPNAKLSSDLKHLINLLDYNTFTGEASVFSITGRVLAAHQLMKKVKYELVPACAAASMFDTIFSTAALYQKFENNRVHYSFAKYIIDAHAPYVGAKAFWNPGVDANIVVTNDIELGGGKPNNIILTGPNTGGKSTVIKSALINLLLAQTIGIAPCDDLIFTPFAVLNCYLNITDDLSAGVSLFKAEVLRAKALIEAIRRLGLGQFSFTIMDEVFSGTSPKEGEEAAFMFAKELGTMQNSICSIATHFPKLTELEETNKFKNYQVKVWKDEQNNWVRPFKLEEGKSTLNIAMDLLEEAGIFSH